MQEKKYVYGFAFLHSFIAMANKRVRKLLKKIDTSVSRIYGNVGMTKLHYKLWSSVVQVECLDE